MTYAKDSQRDGSDPDLHPAQIAAYQAMSFADKMTAFSNLYRQARNLKFAWLKSQHPEWTDKEINAEVSRIFLHAEW